MNGRLWAVVERDLRRFMRNPIVVVAGVLLPMVHLVILGSSFQGQLKHLPVAVVDQDHGPAARRVAALLFGLETGPQTIRVVPVSDQRRAAEMVRAGVVKAALIIPTNFSRDLARGSTPNLGLLTDNTDTISQKTITGALREAMPYLTQEVVAIRPDSSSPRLRPVELYPQVDYDASLVPGAVVMALFVGALGTGAVNLVLDKFLGIHESYLVTPLTRRDIVIGLHLSGTLIVTFSAVLVLILGLAVTGLTVSGGVMTWLLLFAFIVLTAWGALSLTFFLLARVAHPRIVGLFGGFLNVILFFPSGAVYPIESFPPWLRAFAAVNPETYAVHAIRSLIFKGANPIAVAWDAVFLAGFAVVMMLAAIAAFKRTL